MTELELYQSNITQTRKNVVEVHTEVTHVRETVDDILSALNTPGDVENRLEKLGKNIDTVISVLKITGKVGALAAPSKALVRVLEDTKDVVVKLEKKAEDAQKKIDDTGIKDPFEDARDKLVEAELTLTEMEDRIDHQIEAVDQFLCTVDILAPTSDSWEDAANALADGANDAVEALNDTYDTIKSEVQAALDVFDMSVVNPVLGVGRDITAILSKIDFLDGPLSVARTLLKPIEPILTAVDAVSKAIVDPVVDRLIDELGLDSVLDRVQDEIDALLPDIDVFDGFTGALDDFKLEAESIDLSVFDYEAWLADIETDLLDSFEDAKTGPTGLGDVDGPSADVLLGSVSEEAIFGGELNDTISGLAETDFIMASAGDDFIDGGAGDDYVFFKANFSEFIYSYEQGGPFTFQHIQPRRGSADLGLEILTDVEYAAFVDGSIYEIADLIANTKTATAGVVLNGTANDDFLYAASINTPLNAFGLAGNDRITGSTGNDSLNGGTGDDVLDSRGGEDTIVGGSGNDTWLVVSDGNVLGDLADKWGAISSQQVSLLSIENLVLQGAGRASFNGNGQANKLVGDDQEDTLKGNIGDDTLVGGGNDDWLFAGDGIDVLLGGGGSDTLVGGWNTVGGETYDGGDDNARDTLAYSWQPVREDYGSFGGISDVHESDFDDDAGSVFVTAKSGRVKRIADDGSTVLATDTAIDIERFIGSTSDDTMVGGYFGVEYHEIHGGDGNDTMFTRSIRKTDGGGGDDFINVTIDPDFYFDYGNSVTENMTVDGGSGQDKVTFANIDDTRVFLRMGENSGRAEIYRVEAADDLSNAEENSRSLLTTASLTSIESVRLTALNDELEYQGDDTLEAFGGAGNDSMEADDGEVIFRGEAGDDDFYINGSVEGAVYGGSGNDHIRIDDANNAFIVNGGSGDDVVVVGGRGGLDLTGSSGFDKLIINFRTAGVPVTIDLQNEMFSVTESLNSNFVTLGGTIVGFEEVVGSQISDIIIGRDNYNDRIIGRENNDTITGGSGDDEIWGNEGLDNIDGGTGNDTIVGGLGNNVLDGGAGIDTLSFANVVGSGARRRWDNTETGDDGDLYAEHFFAARVDLSTGLSQLITEGGATQSNETISNFENIYGSAFSDDLTGDNGDNVISGNEGDDLLNGLDGDDVLLMGGGTTTANGGGGDDRVVIGSGGGQATGGGGNDTLVLGNEAVSAIVDYSDREVKLVQETPVAVWADGGTEATRGGLTAQDVLEANPYWSNDVGDRTREVPGEEASNGEQYLISIETEEVEADVSFSGFEAIEGGTMLTRLLPSLNADFFDGTVGTQDVLDFGHIAGGVTYDLATQVATDAKLVGDTFIGIDQLWGSNSDDTLYGAKRADVLRGRNEDDLLAGRGGNDTILGQFGNDTLYGGTGADSITGGQGNDFIGGGEGADDLKGNDGNDTLYGVNGQDTLAGGDGNDILFGGNGADTFVYLDGGDADTISDLESKDTILVNRALMDGNGDISDLVDTYGQQVGRNVVMDFGGGDILTIVGATLDEIEDVMAFV